ncbi:hypothetical protein GCM10008171_33270 [Methylopila jiangsuensis]|uniref:Uncharacterized protein n=1 Tax=Methylopila jiangsuensis TaxID=586230 RepID=A0A9W6N571_9HYPH|nr:hypothetical protein GCM10008171_33270 [Methylopila jiangsuensis]
MSAKNLTLADAPASLALHEGLNARRSVQVAAFKKFQQRSEYQGALMDIEARRRRFVDNALFTAFLAGFAAGRDVIKGIADDYMTSEKHHPDYVLIPKEKFEQLLSAAKDCA